MKKMSFKRRLTVVTMICILLLSGCSSSNQNNKMSSSEQEEVTAQDENKEIDEVNGNNEEYVIDVDELRTYIGTEELTLENWEEYFEIIEEEPEPTTDAFGEKVTDGSRYISLIIHAKDFAYGVDDSVAMRFSLTYTVQDGYYNMETEEYVEDEENYGQFSQYEENEEKDIKFYEENITEHNALYIIDVLSQASPDSNNICSRVERNITECDLEKIQGIVGVVNIPDKVWNTDENSERYIAVKSDKGIARIWKNHYVNTDGSNISKGGYSSDDLIYYMITMYLEEIES